MARKPAPPPPPPPPPDPAPPPRRGGRPPYVPTDQDRVMVRLLCAGGIVLDRIAEAIGVSRHTLSKHFRAEIRMGATEIDAQAVGALVRAMRGGGRQSVAAAKWWTQARMRWTERIEVDDGKTPSDAPMRVIVELVGDAAAPRDGQETARTGFRVPQDVELRG